MPDDRDRRPVHGRALASRLVRGLRGAGRRLSRTTVLTLVAIVVSAAGGTFGAWTAGQRADRRLRQELLRDGVSLAQNLPLASVMALCGTADDLRSPNYLRLKAQLAAARHADPRWRFVYLLGRRGDGTVFIFVDSEDPGSPDYSPPGQAYDEVTRETWEVFDGRRAVVGGPVTDRWGQWMSVVAPVVDVEEGRALPAVLGLDISARLWVSMVWQARLPWAVLTAVVVALVALGGHLLGRKGRPRGLEAALVATGGLVATAAVAWFAHGAEVSRAEEGFRWLADQRIHMVEHAVDAVHEVGLESLARFVEASQHVDFDEFGIFAQHLAGNRDVLAWAWVPAVAAKDRTRFEQEARLEGPTNTFVVWEPDGKGRRGVSKIRETLYPLRHIFPIEDHIDLLGLDLGSDPKCLHAMTEAALTRLSSGCDSSLLAGVDGVGRVAFRPVFGTEASRRLVGFAVAVIHRDAFLSRPHPGDPGGSAVDESLHELRPDGSRRLVTSTGGTFGGEDEALGSGALARSLLFVCDRTLLFTARPGLALGGARPARLGLMTALAGLLITGLSTLLASVLAGRQARLDRMVRESTAELEESRGRLAAMLGSMSDAVIATDEAGRVDLVNPVAERLTGWSEAEARGRPVNDVLQLMDELTGATVEGPVKRALRHEGSEQPPRESVLLARDGARCEVAEACAAIRDLSGAIVGAVIVFRDESAERAASRALRESESRFRRLFEESPVAYQSLDVTGRIVTVNPAWLKLLGREMEEVIGRSVEDFVAPAGRAPFALAFRRLTEQGATHGEEMEMSRRDGSSVFVQMDGVFVKDEAGRRLYGHCALHDVTKRKRAEAVVQRQVEELRRWHAATLGREERVVELKREVDELLLRLGQAPRYPKLEASARSSADRTDLRGRRRG